MEHKKPRPLAMKKAWAYFAQDGNVQFATIAATKRESREQLDRISKGWEFHEGIGWELHRVSVAIDLANTTNTSADL